MRGFYLETKNYNTAYKKKRIYVRNTFLTEANFTNIEMPDLSEQIFFLLKDN